MESYGNDKKLPISIPEFYKGKSVFITGFTGVLGKLLVEKLLYSCPEIDKIYVLIRKKKGVDIQDRLKNVFESLAFKRIHEKYPGVLEKKVIAVGGDILEDCLGISKSDEELLRRDVSIVFHGAASVKFDDPLDIALQRNTHPTIKMINLALTMPNLQCFCYISTAYTNCDNIYIKEELYPPKADWKDTLIQSKKIDPSTFQILSKKYIGKLPNTYVFTKSLAEDIINEHRDRLPVVILRPSVVIPSWEEPIPGWVDNIYGPMGLSIGIFLGVIRAAPLDKDVKTNYIPSDIVVNSIIIVAWKTALYQNPNEIKNSVKVYNGCSPKSFNLSPDDIASTYETVKSIRHLMERDGIYCLWYRFCNNGFFYYINKISREIISAIFIDSVLKMINKKPILLKIRRKAYVALNALRHFTNNFFLFDSHNFMELVNDINPEDREAFGWNFDTCDISTIYAESYDVVATTILKPLYDDIDNNSKMLRGLYYVDKTIYYLICFIVTGLILHNFNIPLTIFNLFFY